MNTAVAIKMDQHYTWDDYRNWPDDERWELIEGIPYALASPTSNHQSIVMTLGGALLAHFKKRACRVFPAPMDVRLSDVDVVQPDLLVVCNKDQIKPTHIEGAPSLVIEIVSPSSFTRDRVKKMDLYAHAGVSEYWIITPVPATVEIYQLVNGQFVYWKGFERTDTLTSPSFPDLNISLQTIFEEILDEEKHQMTVHEEQADYQV